MGQTPPSIHTPQLKRSHKTFLNSFHEEKKVYPLKENKRKKDFLSISVRFGVGPIIRIG